MKVYGVTISPNVRKVLAALEIKGLEYEQISVLPGTKTPEFLAISPRGFIPAFGDGDFHISDSSIIIEYIEAMHPETSLIPSNPQDRAKCRWLEEYAGSVLFPACAVVFQEVVLQPNFYKQKTDEARVATALNETLPPIFDYLEDQAPENGFFFGENIGLADISVVSPIINAEFGKFHIDDARWPKMAAMVKRIKAHPVFVKLLMEEEKTIMGIISGELVAS
ncbi:glutathione S-transferase family protein [Sneathiella marina]|uniref:Glutathione S-transferase family protein n=1 Tax=Sneathiella marina TaxID=2950108 RepID=A0ABY4VYS6_9PROT|nr:glutathione S-transferase family protein [Sneathiella marina]USG60080.1 glutathione S-transferase family protein [Sneathiella marina]